MGNNQTTLDTFKILKLNSASVLLPLKLILLIFKLTGPQLPSTQYKLTLQALLCDSKCF